MQTDFSQLEFDIHVNRHLQKHLDEYTPMKKTAWEACSIPEGMNRDLLKVFEKYKINRLVEEWLLEQCFTGPQSRTGTADYTI